jgi:ribosomal protein S12 methylthiotransferase accessory factor
MSTDEQMEFSETLDGLGLDDLQRISDVIGVIFPEDSPWSSLRIGELKAMVALATGELEGAAQWCHWCHSFEFVPAARRRLYRVIHDLIDFELSDEDPAAYQSSLKQFFGEELVAKGQQILKGKLAFYGLNFADSWEEISPAHDELLRVYEKLRPLKIAGHP